MKFYIWLDITFIHLLATRKELLKQLILNRRITCHIHYVLFSSTHFWWSSKTKKNSCHKILFSQTQVNSYVGCESFAVIFDILVNYYAYITVETKGLFTHTVSVSVPVTVKFLTLCQWKQTVWWRDWVQNPFCPSNGPSPFTQCKFDGDGTCKQALKWDGKSYYIDTLYTLLMIRKYFRQKWHQLWCDFSEMLDVMTWMFIFVMFFEQNESN